MLTLYICADTSIRKQLLRQCANFSNHSGYLVKHNKLLGSLKLSLPLTLPPALVRNAMKSWANHNAYGIIS